MLRPWHGWPGAQRMRQLAAATTASAWLQACRGQSTSNPVLRFLPATCMLAWGSASACLAGRITEPNAGPNSQPRIAVIQGQGRMMAETQGQADERVLAAAASAPIQKLHCWPASRKESSKLHPSPGVASDSRRAVPLRGVCRSAGRVRGSCKTKSRTKSKTRQSRRKCARRRHPVG